MKKISELKKIVQEGLERVKQEPGLLEAVVYASANHRTVGRLVYTTHIPSNGLEEPKSDEDVGVNVDIWFEKDGKKLNGFGQEPHDISIGAIERALEKAKRDAVEDPEFYGFFKKESLSDTIFHLKEGSFDKTFIDIDVQKEAELLSTLSWETIEGATTVIKKYAQEHNISLEDMAFILNGDHFLIRERMAMASTNGISESDESTIILSFLTAMVEKENAKGSAWDARMYVQDVDPYKMGEEVAQAAIKNSGGKRVDGGEYTVIFGPQAVAELLGGLLLPHLTLGMIDFGASFFVGQLGQQVASSHLTIFDDATADNAAGSKRVTDEGAPTKRVNLIEDGKLVGFLTDYRISSKMLHEEAQTKEKLGTSTQLDTLVFEPRNGFRFSRGGGRIAAAGVGTHASNLTITSSQTVPQTDLIKQVENGIYIGRLWYTYPVGGYASGIISGTAIADNYVIRDGKLAEPILPNTLRLEDNLKTMITNIIGISDNHRPTILWASDEITHAPLVAIKDVTFHSINNEVLNHKV